MSGQVRENFVIAAVIIFSLWQCVNRCGALAECATVAYSVCTMLDIVRAALPYVQVILSLLLIAAIVLQQTSAGLGGVFGGNDDSVHYTRRGLERTIFQATFVLAVLYFIAAFVALFI